MKRALLFGVSIASLLLLTYAGVAVAFSIPVTDEMRAAHPDVPAGARALVVPISDRAGVATAASGAEAALLARGNASGAFPSAATNVRLGRALVHVAEGANGTVDVEGLTLDLAAMSGGREGWIAKGAAETDPWFSPAEDTLGTVERFETSARLGALFAAGALGFVAPLVAVIVTHRGAKRPPGAAAPAPAIATACRECRAPLAADAEFCMRCGAYVKGDRVG